MRLVNRGVLVEFASEHAEVRGPLAAWEAEVRAAEWETPANVKARYPSTSLMKGNRVVFNLKGQKYRVDVRVDYVARVVLIHRIGTHAEYSTWTY